MERLVAFVKADCETCQMVAPVLGQLRDRGALDEIITQDDPTFPNLSSTYDEDLELSLIHISEPTRPY